MRFMLCSTKISNLPSISPGDETNYYILISEDYEKIIPYLFKIDVEFINFIFTELRCRRKYLPSKYIDDLTLHIEDIVNIKGISTEIIHNLKQPDKAIYITSFVKFMRNVTITLEKLKKKLSSTTFTVENFISSSPKQGEEQIEIFYV